jgi:hypothetical protein
MATEEQLEFRRRWVAALRSGDYRQGRGALKTKFGGMAEYCCLGVLCEVLGIEGGENDAYLYSFEGHVGNLPTSVRNKVGLRDAYGSFNHGDSLAGWNDTGRSFSEIADIIESEPKGLFLD